MLTATSFDGFLGFRPQVSSNSKRDAPTAVHLISECRSEYLTQRSLLDAAVTAASA